MPSSVTRSIRIIGHDSNKPTFETTGLRKRHQDGPDRHGFNVSFSNDHRPASSLASRFISTTETERIL